MTTYAVLFMLLRSVFLPLKALAMNTLSIVASFGALVWIFQDAATAVGAARVRAARVRRDHAAGDPLRVLFGLSMDYEVFLLSRMKEVWD